MHDVAMHTTAALSTTLQTGQATDPHATMDLVHMTVTALKRTKCELCKEWFLQRGGGGNQSKCAWGWTFEQVYACIVCTGYAGNKF